MKKEFVTFYNLNSSECEMICNNSEIPVNLDEFVIENGVVKKCISNAKIIRIPDGVKCLDGFSVKSESLEKLIISNSVAEIKYFDLFNIYCEKLSDIIVMPKNKKFSDIDGVLYTADKSEILLCPIAKKSHEIADGTIYIRKNAFYLCKSIEKIIIPDSVIEIGDNAFQFCKNLKSIVISSSVRKIGNKAFSDCNRLENITISNTLSEIGKNLFAGKSMRDVPLYINIIDTTMGLSDATAEKIHKQFSKILAKIDKKLAREYQRNHTVKNYLLIKKGFLGIAPT